MIPYKALEQLIKGTADATDWPHLILSKKWMDFLHKHRCTTRALGDIRKAKKRRYGDESLLNDRVDLRKG